VRCVDLFDRDEVASAARQVKLALAGSVRDRNRGAGCGVLHVEDETIGTQGNALTALSRRTRRVDSNSLEDGRMSCATRRKKRVACCVSSPEAASLDTRRVERTAFRAAMKNLE
jgi:hypothetical protein